MSLFISSLNSGSNGNCYYVGNAHEAVLIDAGISCRETEKRMQRLGLSMEKVKAVFISHEHSDHIRGVEVLSKKYNLPVYITPKTMFSGKLILKQEVTFKAYQPVAVGGITVTGFPKSHDASDPHSFTLEFNGVTVGVFTDIGFVCGHVLSNFKKCHAIFLEANYDEEMLEQGHYPYYLKRRIRNDKGHLSNAQALDLFTKHKPGFMSHVLLSHLSRENNSPQLVKNVFEAHAGGTEVIVASRDYETAVYHITAGAVNNLGAKRAEIFKESLQTTLF